MSIELFKAFVTGMTDYINRHNANYTLIEANLDYLLSMIGGQAGSGGLGISSTLAEIFDRQGLIGIGSYDFDEGPPALAGPNYNLVLAPGAYWSGASGIFRSKVNTSTISMLGQPTGTYYVYLDGAGNPVVSNTAADDTIWQFAWSTVTHVVSSKVRYAGVSVLFDGDDYADQLTSTARGKNFTKVADRLEEIEQLLSSTSGFYAEDPDNHAGLDFYYLAGKVRNDSVIYETDAGHVTLADNDTCYIEVDPADGTVSTNVIGYTSGQIALYKVVTVAGEIDDVTDERTWAIAGTGGGGGGHTQNTDAGTSLPTFTLNLGTGGAPVDDCKLEVERGDAENVSLRWSEAEAKWQYTNDGVNYYNIGDVSIALGSQELTKFVSIDEPPEVWTELGRGASLFWEDLDLSTYITAMQGCSGVVLRVFFWDSAPGPGVNVMFRKKNAPAAPALANSAWKDEYDPSMIIVGVDEFLTGQFFVNASGADTSNMRVFLLGYFEKVVGVGTQDRTFVPTAITVSPSTHTTSNKTGFMNRGLVNYLKVSETGGLVVGTYAIEVFSKDSFNVSVSPSKSPSISPSASISPSKSPSTSPSVSPSTSPSVSVSPSVSPSKSPSISPSSSESISPSVSPSVSKSPSISPSASPSISPSISPSVSPSASKSPSISPSVSPSAAVVDEYLLYRATAIDPATDYKDWLPWFYRDEDDTSELHVKITNNDAANSGIYEITIKAEQFA